MFRERITTPIDPIPQEYVNELNRKEDEEQKSIIVSYAPTKLLKLTCFENAGTQQLRGIPAFKLSKMGFYKGFLYDCQESGA